MKYFRKICGDRVYLSPMNADDAELYTKWLNDVEVSGNLTNYSQMISLAGERDYLNSASKEGHNYAIVLAENDTLIGNISLMNINNINRSAIVGIFIGEAEYRSKGYGSEAMRLMLKYGFETLNLHSVMLEVLSINERAIACYKKVGFKEIGQRRETLFHNGKYVNMILMDILSGEL